jgi:hypothetical protein
MIWPEPWIPIDNLSQCRWFEEELRREVPPGHALSGIEVRAIAWIGGEFYDVLYALTDGRVAEVHLTRAVETNPVFPCTTIHASLQAWALSVAR